MRILKYALLGLIEKEEISGYDISNQFKREIGEFWSAKHSQIYPELKRLTAEGLIEYRTLITGIKLEKKFTALRKKASKNYLIG